MTWELSKLEREMRLRSMFAQLGINCNEPGFCDTPEFKMVESSNPRIMESYAEFIEVKHYESDYLTNAHKKIAIVAEIMRQALEEDGRLGACVDVSGIIGRMLDKLGVWNYVAKSTLTISYPVEAELSDTYFWAIDTGEFEAPHAVVVAPPFGIIDVSLRYQDYSDNQAHFLPHAVLADKFTLTEWQPEDLACDYLLTDLRDMRITFKNYLEQDYPHMLEVILGLPPRELSIDETKLKYVIVAVGGFMEQLEDIVSYRPSGKTALEIFNNYVQPRIQLL